MKILVTGGAGFIASHLVDKYIKKGHQVVVLDNLSTGFKQNLNPKARFYDLDIRSKELTGLIKKEKPDVINHHAAQINLRKSVENPLEDAEINILGLLNLMEGAVKSRSVNRVIFASTGGAIYGDADIMPTPESYLAKPISPYGISKLSGESYLYYYQETFKIPSVCLRYGNVYGPRQNPHGEAGVIAIFAKQMLEGKQSVINGNGKQTRDFVYVEDVVNANLLATTDEISGIFNIGTGKETDINAIYRKLSSEFDFKNKAPHGPAKQGEQQRSVLDATKALKTFGWKPIVELDEGLHQTAEFFKNQ